MTAPGHNHSVPSHAPALPDSSVAAQEALEAAHTALTAVLVTVTATTWNYVWNMMYEAFERRRGMRGRRAGSRALHAFGYEGGVLIFTVPLVALLLSVSLWEALMIEGGLLVFFLVFTVLYTWAFDRVCGLPASAR